MNVDFSLPAVIFAVSMITLFFYKKLEKRIRIVFEERKLNYRDIFLLVCGMGGMITVVVFIPKLALQVLFVTSYIYMLFSFVYLTTKKKLVSLLPPLIFLLFYLFHWESYVINIFALIFSIVVTIYLSAFFSWKTSLAFALLLTLMDVIQVFVTGFMGQAAGKMLVLRLPGLITIPTFPLIAEITLGLGDICLSGLMIIQTSLKEGQKAGILAAAMISVGMFVFEILLFNKVFGGIRFFPATIVVISGWFMAILMLKLNAGHSKISMNQSID